ncbi:MAG TPA: TPM domain-containing protein [Dehalococcoidales bacterium]|nr:TPM domain-containing protein [Dehalococcoidales bacterium]
MKSLFISFFAGLLVLLLAGSPLQAQSYPQPVGFINDFGYLLKDETITRLEARLVALEKDTSAELAVVTLDNLAGHSLEEYAAGLFSDWKIGKTGKDNGVLLLVAWDQNVSRYRYRIEVGYGLEGVITDGRAGRVLDNDILPQTRKGDFDAGIEAGVIALENYIRGGLPPSVVEENPVQKALASYKFPFWSLILLGMFSIYLLGFMARSKSIWLGGIWGVISGLFLGFGFGGLLWMIILPLGMGIFGTLLDAVVSANYRSLKSGGHSTGWYRSGGGFRGPGGSFGGGGFGGFGGGRSGGGGASR